MTNRKQRTDDDDCGYLRIKTSASWLASRISGVSTKFVEERRGNTSFITNAWPHYSSVAWWRRQ